MVEEEPNSKLSSINQYSTGCSVGMLFLLCWMWVPAAPARFYLGDLYILNWRKPASSQTLWGVLFKQLPPLEEKMNVCPAWHHEFIIHKEHYKQASFNQPFPPEWSWAHPEGVTFLLHHTWEKISCCTLPAIEGLSHLRGRIWMKQQSTNDTGQKTSAALASTGSTQVTTLNCQAFEPVIKPTAMLESCSMWLGGFCSLKTYLSQCIVH